MKKPGARPGFGWKGWERVQTGRAGQVPPVTASFGGQDVGCVPAGLLDWGVIARGVITCGGIFCGLIVLIAGEEVRQRLGVLAGCNGRVVEGSAAQRLGQPARAFEQPFGLLGHVAFLEVIDQPDRILAPRLTHRFEDARLGDPAEVILGRRSPARLDHIEANGLREPVRLPDAVLDAFV